MKNSLTYKLQKKVFFLIMVTFVCSLSVSCSDSSGLDPTATYTITFDPNGGIGGPDPMPAIYGTPMPNLSGQSAPTKQGDSFIGYFDAPDVGEMYYNRDLVPMFDYWDKIGDTTLFAEWE